MKKLPIYAVTPHTQLRPGLYLGLFNGRRSKTQEMANWGANGPLIGPLESCHEVGGCELNLKLAEGADIKAHAKITDIHNDFEMTLKIDGGEYIKIGRFYYGDWTFFTVEAKRTAREQLLDKLEATEEDAFYAKLCDDEIWPLDQSAAGLKRWVKLYDQWQDAKASNADAPLLDDLAALGTGHIYCDLIRARREAL